MKCLCRLLQCETHSYKTLHMKMKHIAGLAWATAGLLSAPADAQTASVGYLPELHGTVRAKYEYSPPIGKGRFEVRNARLSAEGKVVPAVDYKAEIDLSDEGNIRMLDAFVSFRPGRRFRFTMGQRVPFSIDAHCSPHLQYFAHRSFIAKQTGDVRDVGIAAAWTVGRRQSVTLEGSLFNGSGLTNLKNFWTGGYNFALKGQTVVGRLLALSGCFANRLPQEASPQYVHRSLRGRRQQGAESCGDILSGVAARGPAGGARTLLCVCRTPFRLVRGAS